MQSKPQKIYTCSMKSKRKRKKIGSGILLFSPQSAWEEAQAQGKQPFSIDVKGREDANRRRVTDKGRITTIRRVVYRGNNHNIVAYLTKRLPSMTKGNIFGNIVAIDVKYKGILQVSKVRIAKWRLMELLCHWYLVHEAWLIIDL